MLIRRTNKNFKIKIMNYRKIEIWKNRGFITNNLSSEKQLELGKNLSFSKDILNCFNVLENYDEDFYKNVESVLYPTIVYYTLNKNELLKQKPIVHNFIRFCENTINVKYNLSEYNQDYLLCQDFISQN